MRWRVIIIRLLCLLCLFGSYSAQAMTIACQDPDEPNGAFRHFFRHEEKKSFWGTKIVVSERYGDGWYDFCRESNGIVELSCNVSRGYGSFTQREIMGGVRFKKGDIMIQEVDFKHLTFTLTFSGSRSGVVTAPCIRID
jgi:hypothetical protein